MPLRGACLLIRIAYAMRFAYALRVVCELDALTRLYACLRVACLRSHTHMHTQAHI